MPRNQPFIVAFAGGKHHPGRKTRHGITGPVSRCAKAGVTHLRQPPVGPASH
jgi:hypothetical protein